LDKISITDTIASEDLHVTVSDGRGAPSTRARAIQIILLIELSLGYASWGSRWWAQVDIITERTLAGRNQI
jgi:hypothetical protein